MSIFNFDKENHIYTLDDVRLMSVTEILVRSGVVDTRFFTEDGRLRGTAVHDAVFLHINNDLNFDALHPLIAPYVQAYLKFEKDTGFIPMSKFCEQTYYHPIYKYAGKIDDMGLLNKRYLLIDIKTGACTSTQFQSAAYLEMPQIKCYEPSRIELRLLADGTYRVKKFMNTSDFVQFIEYQRQAQEHLALETELNQ